MATKQNILEIFHQRREGASPPTTPEPKKKLFDLPNVRFGELYDCQSKLGNGAFSTVNKCVEKATGKAFAVKMIDKSLINNSESVRTEARILMKLRHPNIITMYTMFEDDQYVYLVLELMEGGELYDRIAAKHDRGYKESQAKQLVKNIVGAVEYLHNSHVIHRDLKPDNLLLASPNDEINDVKISDFGLSKICSGGTLVRTSCGTRNYIAPEIILNELHGYTYSVDMWSIGVITYVLLCGFCPFYSENDAELYRLIRQGRYTFPSPYWDNVSDLAKDFVRRLLVVKPDARMTASEALKHPWIVSEENTAELVGFGARLANYQRVEKAASAQQRAETEVPPPHGR